MSCHLKYWWYSTGNLQYRYWYLRWGLRWEPFPSLVKHTSSGQLWQVWHDWAVKSRVAEKRAEIHWTPVLILPRNLTLPVRVHFPSSTCTDQARNPIHCPFKTRSPNLSTTLQIALLSINWSHTAVETYLWAALRLRNIPRIDDGRRFPSPSLSCSDLARILCHCPHRDIARYYLCRIPTCIALPFLPSRIRHWGYWYQRVPEQGLQIRQNPWALCSSIHTLKLVSTDSIMPSLGLVLGIFDALASQSIAGNVLRDGVLEYQEFPTLRWANTPVEDWLYRPQTSCLTILDICTE